MKKFVDRIMNVIKLVSVTSFDDSQDYPSLAVKFADLDKDAVRLCQYGFYSAPPKNSLAICFSADGDEAKMFAIADDYPKRFKNLKEGETKVGNPLKGTFTYYNDAGNVIHSTEGNNVLLGSTVYVGSPDISLLEKITEALGEVSTAFDYIATMATYPTAVGPTGTMIDPSVVIGAKNAIDAIKADIESITGGPE